MNTEVPIQIRVLQNQKTEIQYSTDLLLVFTTGGSVCVTVNRQQNQMTFGGILVINPYSHYNFSCEQDAACAILQISQKMLQIVRWEQLQINCYVRDNAPGEGGKNDRIRACLARIFQMVFRNAKTNEPQLIEEASRLLGILSEQFVTPEQKWIAEDYSDPAWKRYDRILKFLHEHWSEPITLERIAKQEYVSTGYLSHFFKNKTGMTIVKYLTDIRLTHTANDLANSRKSISEIAYTNGFGSANTFILQFKGKYGRTPNQYRKLNSEKKIFPPDLEKIPMEEGIANFLKYAYISDKQEENPLLPKRIQTIAGKVDEEGMLLRHTWRRMLNIGYARDGLLATVQDQLRQAQSEIGFEYLRFHGILDDDMHIYRENEEGTPTLNFSLVDLLLDFIISLGLKPYIELSFMPEQLLREKKRTHDRTSFISIYNSEKKWRFLTRGLVHHFAERYGRTQVLSWRFTTIGANLVTAGFLTIEEYLALYRTAYESVKEVDSEFRFGGPGCFSSAFWEGSLLQSFLEYTGANKCLPDFICMQCYPYTSIAQDNEFIRFTISQASAPSILSADESFTKTTLQECKKILAHYELDHLPVWIEEWNSTLWQRDLSSETCYKSAWLIKNLCENYDQAEAFGYWTLSDFMEERSDFRDIFHGGYGLFTYNGIPKSGYMAMKLMRLIGNRLLCAGDRWMITKNEHEIQIVLSHYCHYDNLYRLRYQKLSDPHQAYSVFINSSNMEYHFSLTGLSAGKYEIRKYSITQDHGSSFDAWLRIGAPQYMKKAESDYLKLTSQPEYSVDFQELYTNYQFITELKPHEIQVFILKRIG